MIFPQPPFPAADKTRAAGADGPLPLPPARSLGADMAAFARLFADGGSVPAGDAALPQFDAHALGWAGHAAMRMGAGSVALAGETAGLAIGRDRSGADGQTGSGTDAIAAQILPPIEPEAAPFTPLAEGLFPPASRQTALGLPLAELNGAAATHLPAAKGAQRPINPQQGNAAGTAPATPDRAALDRPDAAAWKDAAQVQATTPVDRAKGALAGSDPKTTLQVDPGRSSAPEITARTAQNAEAPGNSTPLKPAARKEPATPALPGGTAISTARGDGTPANPVPTPIVAAKPGPGSPGFPAASSGLGSVAPIVAPQASANPAAETALVPRRLQNPAEAKPHAPNGNVPVAPPVGADAASARSRHVEPTSSPAGTKTAIAEIQPANRESQTAATSRDGERRAVPAGPVPARSAPVPASLQPPPAAAPVILQPAQSATGTAQFAARLDSIAIPQESNGDVPLSDAGSRVEKTAEAAIRLSRPVPPARPAAPATAPTLTKPQSARTNNAAAAALSPGFAVTTSEEPSVPQELVGHDASAPQQPVEAPAPARTLHAAPRIAPQILDAMRALAPGQPVEIELNPRELGLVRLTLTDFDGQLSLQIAVERPETLDLMRRHIDLLTQDLRQAGYHSLSLDIGSGRGGGDRTAHDAGTAAETTPELPIAETAPAGRRVNAEGRLDIRL